MAPPGMPSRPFDRPFVCPRFVSGADLGNPWEDLFHIAHTHPLGGVDVPFGVCKPGPTYGRPTVIINFNVPDIWQTGSYS